MQTVCLASKYRYNTAISKYTLCIVPKLYMQSKRTNERDWSKKREKVAAEKRGVFATRTTNRSKCTRLPRRGFNISIYLYLYVCRDKVQRSAGERAKEREREREKEVIVRRVSASTRIQVVDSHYPTELAYIFTHLLWNLRARIRARGREICSPLYTIALAAELGYIRNLERKQQSVYAPICADKGKTVTVCCCSFFFVEFTLGEK